VLSINPYRLFIARLLLGLYVLTLINGVVFRHAHRLADGTIVSHAHPYIPIDTADGGPYQPSNHTQQEIIWLDALSHAFYDDWQPALFVLLLPLVVGILRLPPLFQESVFQPATQAVFRHRGPPAL
jgi:hypothetical protein